MKARLAISLGALLLGGVVGLPSVTAQSAAPAQEQKPGTEKPAKPAATQATRRHVGTVKAVDPAAKTLTVEAKSGEVTITIGDKTTIRRGKDTVRLEDLRTGDQITVVYGDQDGKHVARRITVRAQ